MADRVKGIILWFAGDQNGKIILWQKPNIALTIWFLCLVASYLPIGEMVKNGLTSTSRAFLLAWAYMEIQNGASNFRRALGAVVAVGVLASFFR